MLLTSVNEIDSRLGEGSKATIADVSIYRGKMGTGITDAYQLLMQIEGTPCLQVALGEVQLIPLTQHFGQGAEDLTYTDIQMSAKDMWTATVPVPTSTTTPSASARTIRNISPLTAPGRTWR